MPNEHHAAATAVLLVIAPVDRFLGQPARCMKLLIAPVTHNVGTIPHLELGQLPSLLPACFRVQHTVVPERLLEVGHRRELHDGWVQPHREAEPRRIIHDAVRVPAKRLHSVVQGHHPAAMERC